MAQGANRTEEDQGVFGNLARVSLEEAMWIPESNFPFPNELKKMIKQDKPVEDRGSGSGG